MQIASSALTPEVLTHEAPSTPTASQAVNHAPSGIYIRSGIAQGDYVPLSDGIVTIGRNDSQKIALHDSFVSLEHARIFADGDTYYIEDLQSTNGTVVDGVRIRNPIAIKLGSKITLGKNTLEVI